VEIRLAICRGGIHLKSKESFTIDDIPFLDPVFDKYQKLGGEKMDYLICSRCGEEFDRFEYDEYLEACGHDPIIDHLKGQNPNYPLCPHCKEQERMYRKPDGQILKVCTACGNMRYGYADVIEICDDEECAKNNAYKDRCLYSAEDIGVDIL
jgi:hypothetical protein